MNEAKSCDRGTAKTVSIFLNNSGGMLSGPADKLGFNLLYIIKTV